MRKNRTLRGVLVTAALAGGLLVGTSTPAWAAYWIYHWGGGQPTQAGCLEERQTFIDDNVAAAQPFSAGPCGWHDTNPEVGSGPAGWYYLWGIPGD